MCKQEEIIEFDITPEFKKKILQSAAEMPVYDKSILKGAGNEHGRAGEMIVMHVLGVKMEIRRVSATQYEYDLVTKDRKGATVKLEVKTARCSGEDPPMEHYACNVWQRDGREPQKCDYYIFVRVNYEMTKAWIIGKIKQEVFLDICHVKERGSIDPHDIEGRKVPMQATCKAVLVRDVTAIRLAA